MYQGIDACADRRLEPRPRSRGRDLADPAAPIPKKPTASSSSSRKIGSVPSPSSSMTQANPGPIEIKLQPTATVRGKLVNPGGSAGTRGQVMPMLIMAENKKDAFATRCCARCWGAKPDTPSQRMGCSATEAPAIGSDGMRVSPTYPILQVLRDAQHVRPVRVNAAHEAARRFRAQVRFVLGAVKRSPPLLGNFPKIRATQSKR